MEPPRAGWNSDCFSVCLCVSSCGLSFLICKVGIPISQNGRQNEMRSYIQKPQHSTKHTGAAKCVQPSSCPSPALCFLPLLLPSLIPFSSPMLCAAKHSVRDPDPRVTPRLKSCHASRPTGCYRPARHRSHVDSHFKDFLLSL